MTPVLYKFEKYLNLLLVFLLPSQLALHLWPKFAFIFGIRVDYFSPTIYLTDLIFLSLFVFWAIRSGKNILWNTILKNKFVVLTFLIVCIINICFSTSIIISLLKWFKLIEIAAFAFYVWSRKDIFGKKIFFVTLFCSLLFFSLIGFFQVIKGEAIGGFMYYLGERTFSVNTPGIALARLGNISFLRAYSTFPHPNALAGYLVIGILILAQFLFTKRNVVKITGFIFILIFLCFAFSLSALVGIFFCGFILLIYKIKSLSKKELLVLVLLFFGVSLLSSVLAKPIENTNLILSQSTSQRLDLSYIAGKIISNSFIAGTGLNTFILNEVKVQNFNSNIWLLQPVHNIYLLILSELGIIGGIFLYYFLFKILRKTLGFNNPGIFLAVIFIMTTGLFDHYWFTLQQNMLLLGLLVGISFQVKK